VFGAQLDNEVMISPQAVLTEGRTPRATRPDGFNPLGHDAS